MDDLSKLASAVGGGSSGGAGAADLAGLAGAVQESGGLDGLLAKLRQGGLGEHVDSWISTGQNRPVDPQQLGQALGPETLQRLSSGSGLDASALLPLLAAFLPQIVDMLTPDGQVPTGGIGSGARGMPDLGGLLGGLLGGAGSAGGAPGSAATGGLGNVLGGLLGSEKDR